MRQYRSVIINGFHDVRFNGFLTGFVKEFGVGKCYYLSDTLDKGIDGCETILPSMEKMTLGEYPLAQREMLPVDKSLLESLRDCEVLCLRMMDRLEYNRVIPYQERKRIFLNHVRYWNTIIENEGISLFIANNIPHEIYDYVIYSLCKIKRIQTFFFHQSLTIPDSIFLISDWRDSTVDIGEEYRRLIEAKGNSPALGEVYQKYWDQQTGKGPDPTPFYMTNNVGVFGKIKEKLKAQIQKALKSFKQGIFITLLLRHFSLESINARKRKRYLATETKKLNSEYRKHVFDHPDLSVPFIYVPLHYQPELTTCPLADDYVNQELIVDMISKTVDQGIMVYVKEHPKQTALGRDLGIYSRLTSLPNVKLMPKDLNSYLLINKSIAIATCTGTAGWESLFRKKPVLMFGSFFYQYADGVFKINSLQDCKNAIDAIKVGKKPSEENTKLFLKAVENKTIRAVSDPVYWAISNVSIEEGNINMIKALQERVSSGE